MSTNTNTKSAHLAPPEQEIKDDSSDWESPDENEKDKAPDKRSVQTGAKSKAKTKPLYKKDQTVELMTRLGWEGLYKITRVNTDKTYDLRHVGNDSVKKGVAEKALR